MAFSGFLISGPSSNAGKTTVTMALLRALADQGYNLQPFKAGPDYLDPKLHELAGGKTGLNLDTFLSSEEHVEHIFRFYSSGADIAVAEGVMGLFDGSYKRENSSADLAKQLGLPVIMVIPADAMAYSAAPLIKGFKDFDPEVNLAGVIFNFVDHEAHYNLLKEACRDIGVSPLGYVPHTARMHIPSRHLGLVTEPNEDILEAVKATGDAVKNTIDWNLLLKNTEISLPAFPHTSAMHKTGSSRTIAIASDEAFNFTYPINLEKLKKFGTLKFFSPLHDEHLPAADFVYLAGGYPERYLDRLSRNESMKEDIRSFGQKGGRVYAECGGMMYLGKILTDANGNNYPMSGLLNLSTTMKDSGLRMGYRKTQLNGITVKGHEFHYSRIEQAEGIDEIGKVANARDEQVTSSFYRWKNVFGTYIHHYWGDNEAFLQYLMYD